MTDFEQSVDGRFTRLYEELKPLVRRKRIAAVRVFEPHDFAGHTQAHAADLLGVSLRAANRDWQYARTYLRMQLA